VSLQEESKLLHTDGLEEEIGGILGKYILQQLIDCKKEIVASHIASCIEQKCAPPGLQQHMGIHTDSL
jgi:hypothetical protein